VQPIPAGQHAALHAQRDPQVRLLPAGFADKAGRGDADDGQRSVAQGERLAQHVGTAGEPALPVVVTDHGPGRLSAILGRREYPADRRAHPQHLKKFTRHQAPARFVPLAVLVADLPRLEAALRCHQRREALGVIPQLLEFAVREPAAVAVGTADPPTGPHPRGVGIREHHQLLGFVNSRQRGEQHAVPQAEDRGTGSGAEGQRKNGDGGEAGPRGHRAQCVAHVLKNHVPVLLRGDRQRVQGGVQPQDR
jgi:hypothetical protein